MLRVRRSHRRANRQPGSSYDAQYGQVLMAIMLHSGGRCRDLLSLTGSTRIIYRCGSWRWPPSPGHALSARFGPNRRWPDFGGLSRHVNVSSWLQADIRSPQIDFRSTPNFGHSEAHAGLPVVTPCGHDSPGFADHRLAPEPIINWNSVLNPSAVSNCLRHSCTSSQALDRSASPRSATTAR